MKTRIRKRHLLSFVMALAIPAYAANPPIEPKLKVTQDNFPIASNSTDLDGHEEREITGKENIAYINGDPAIPDLDSIVLGCGARDKVKWNLTLVTERADKRGDKDDRSFGPVVLAGDKEWDIQKEFQGEFVGGKATLKYAINGGDEKVFQFKIRGKNPRAATAKTFVTDTVAQRYKSYAWGIVQHESRSGKRVYNQFNPSGSLAEKGFWGFPDGWGISQQDSARGSQITTDEVHNWKINVQSFATALESKRTVFYERFIGYFRDAYGPLPNWKEPPVEYSHEGHEESAEAWGVMIFYNGPERAFPVTTIPIIGDNKKVRNIQTPWRFNPNSGQWEFIDNVKQYGAKVAKELKGQTYEE